MNPILIEVLRGNAVESRHAGALAIVQSPSPLESGTTTTAGEDPCRLALRFSSHFIASR